MLIDRPATAPLHLVAAIGRRLDGAVCAGAVANAARSVRQDELRAGQRREARAAVEQMQRLGLAQPGRGLGARRTG
jgi:hypothetical protein